MVSITTADGVDGEKEVEVVELKNVKEEELKLDNGNHLDSTLAHPNPDLTNASEDIFYVLYPGIGLKIIAPNAEPFEIQVSSNEIVQELHQVLMEREDTCHRTCFSLQLDGVVLDNFSELKTITELKDGSTIKVVEEPYTCREARIHVKHVRDLLKPSDWADAYAGIDCASLSFLNSVSGDVGSGKKRVVDCTPPEYIMPGGGVPLQLLPLHPLNKDNKPIPCLKVLAASGWNPPPGYRKLHGDLMYLIVVTLEDKTCHITATPRGFYLNRSTMDHFDPLPAPPNNFLSHSLIELLNQISPTFRKNFVALQKKRMNRHPFERVATPYQVYSWVSPTQAHTLDAIRAEEAFSSKLGYEEHIPGQTRDWNEELQSTRELPRTTLPERLLRERAIFKVHSDFVSAATRGAVAVIDGNIMAINPGEGHKMQMFIWSNIFFSLGFDVRDHYKDLGGDAAAHIAPRNDLQGVAAFNAIDPEGIFTLGTVVIDYRGYRVTAQSIIPGILEREQDQSVVYGSIDFGKTVVSSEKYLDLLSNVAPKLKVFPHFVKNEKDEIVELSSSVECKGIIGNDSRHYILDLLRTFPPDVNFLKEEAGELNEEVVKLGFPREHAHKLCCLRQELIDVFVDARYMSFIKLAAFHLQHIGIKRQIKGEEEEEVMEEDKKDPGPDGEAPEDSAKKLVEEKINACEGQNPLEASTLQAIKKAADAVCSLSDTEFDIRFNPDIFSPNVRHCSPGGRIFNEIKAKKEEAKDGEKEKEKGDGDRVVENGAAKKEEPNVKEGGDTTNESIPNGVNKEEEEKEYPDLAKQIRLNREACEFLLLVQIPTFVRDVTTSSGTSFFGPNALIMDGDTLTTAMHARGINMRYLGRILVLLRERDEEVREETSRIVVLNSAGTAPMTNGNGSNWALATAPHFITTITAMELITRCAKHVFNPFLQSVDLMNQCLAISHFLNCLLMSGAPVVPPIISDVLMPSKKSHRNKGGRGGGGRVKHHSNGTNGTEWAGLTQALLWEQIKADAKGHYGYEFPGESLDSALSLFGISKHALLRSFAIKVGVQILLREFQFNKPMSGKSNGNTFGPEDILNVFPIVKHINPRATDAYAFLSTAQSKMSSGFFREGYELLSESLNLLNSVYGAFHVDIALCLRSIARLNYVMGEHADALLYQQKALFMSERILGVDHPTTILEYTHLSLYSFANNQVTTALKLLYRARYLSLLVHGENHPHVALLDSNIGLILHAVGEYELSLKFLEKSLDLSRKYFGPRSLKTAVGHHLVARTQSCIGDFRSALMNERETYSIYKEQLGEKHEKTLEASDCLAHLTQQAVVLQRKINDMAVGKDLPPIQIQPPSMGSVLDMLNLINGILFMQISLNSSQQDIENIKAELDARTRDLSPTKGVGGEEEELPTKEEGALEEEKEGVKEGHVEEEKKMEVPPNED